MTIDYSDPAVVLPILRAAYYQILAGAKARTVTIPNSNGGSKQITYYDTSIDKLQAEIRRLEALVAAAAGTTTRRCLIAG